MEKMALVAKTEDILNLCHTKLNDRGVRLLISDTFDDKNIFSLDYELADRAICETDPNVIQLLPYVTLIDRTTAKIFTYQRGNSGNEDRLLGLYSIGLGGHIEEEPTPYATTLDIVAVNVLRELNEEVGLEITADLLGKVTYKLCSEDYKVIYDPTNEVGKHHLCLWIVLPIDPQLLGGCELDIITKGDWLTLTELSELKLESWSANCLAMI